MGLKGGSGWAGRRSFPDSPAPSSPPSEAVRSETGRREGRIIAPGRKVSPTPCAASKAACAATAAAAEDEEASEGSGGRIAAASHRSLILDKRLGGSALPETSRVILQEQD